MVFLTVHISPYFEVPVTLIDWSHEDVLVVGVPDGRVEGKAINTVSPLLLVSLGIFTIFICVVWIWELDFTDKYRRTMRNELN